MGGVGGVRALFSEKVYRNGCGFCFSEQILWLVFMPRFRIFFSLSLSAIKAFIRHISNIIHSMIQYCVMHYIAFK